MNRKLLLMLGAILLLAFISSASWAVPHAMNVQGRLENIVEGLDPNVSINIDFGFYDAESGGNKIWGKPVLLNVDDNGIFNAIITDIPERVFGFGEDLYMQISVVGLGGLEVGPYAMSPRQRIVSTPYSETSGGLAMDAGAYTIVTSPFPELEMNNRAGVIKNDYGGIQTIVKNSFVKENSIVLATFSPPKAGSYYHTLSEVEDGQFKLHFYGKSIVRFLVINTDVTPIDYNMPPQTSGASKYGYLEVVMKSGSDDTIDLVATRTNFMNWGVAPTSPILIGALAVDDGDIMEINLTQHDIDPMLNQTQYPFHITKGTGGNGEITEIRPRLEPDVVDALFNQYIGQFTTVDNFKVKFNDWWNTIKSYNGHLVSYNVVDDAQQESQENPEKEIEFDFMLTGLPIDFGDWDFGYWADGPVFPDWFNQAEEVMSAIGNPAEMATSPYMDGIKDTFASKAELGAYVLEADLAEGIGWSQVELQTFLDNSGYMTSASQLDATKLQGVAPLAVIPDLSSSYLTPGALSTYATQAWVGQQSFATEAWVNGQSYATGGDITTALQGYATVVSLADNATQAWVNGQSFATESWVNGKNYALDSALGSYALKTYVDNNFTPTADFGQLAMRDNVTSGFIADGAITSSKLAPSSITSDRLAVGAISGISAFTSFASVGNLPASTGNGAIAFVTGGTMAEQGMYQDVQGYSWHKISAFGADISKTTGVLQQAQIPVLNTSKIPALDASKITTGTISTSRIPNLDASKITGGTIAQARIPVLDIAKIPNTIARTTNVTELDNLLKGIGSQDDNLRYVRVINLAPPEPLEINRLVEFQKEVRMPKGAGASSGYTHFNYTSNGKNYIRGTTIVADNGGLVGVGTSSPDKAKLQVNGYVTTALNYAWFHRYPTSYTHGGPKESGTYSTNLSIYASHRVAMEQLNVFSDSRIKNVVGLSKGEEDLKTLNKLQVTDYKYVDTISRGNNTKKGFIAQEVEKVYPEAVSKMADFIPNIYKVAEKVVFNDGNKTLKVTMKEKADLKVGDKVRLIADTETGYEKEIIAVSGRSFTVKDWEEDTDKVFVYGKEVKDFRNLDYDQVFSLGISAMQELSKQVKEQQTEIDALKQKINDLEKK